MAFSLIYSAYQLFVKASNELIQQIQSDGSYKWRLSNYFTVSFCKHIWTICNNNLCIELKFNALEKKNNLFIWICAKIVPFHEKLFKLRKKEFRLNSFIFIKAYWLNFGFSFRFRKNTIDEENEFSEKNW